MRIWIDTDVGTNVDDEFALALAARHPAIELVGVSTVAGDVHLRRRIAEGLLSCAGRPEVPVVAGSVGPTVPHEVMSGQEDGVLHIYVPDADRTTPRPQPEGSLTLQAAVERARPDLLVCIGPLGNIGSLDQATAPQARFSVMGGNVGPLPDGRPVEWNWACDPAGASRLLSSGRRIRVHPWSVTSRLTLGEGDLERLASGDRLARALAASARRWRRSPPIPGKPSHRVVRLHDPVALLGPLHPDLVPVEPASILVDDGRGELGDGSPNCHLAVDLDVDGLRRVLLETLLGGAVR